jgi:hypothetical protein
MSAQMGFMNGQRRAAQAQIDRVGALSERLETRLGHGTMQARVIGLRIHWVRM